jgi:hypothetical protein
VMSSIDDPGGSAIPAQLTTMSMLPNSRTHAATSPSAAASSDGEPAYAHARRPSPAMAAAASRARAGVAAVDHRARAVGRQQLGHRPADAPAAAHHHRTSTLRERRVEPRCSCSGTKWARRARKRVKLQSGHMSRNARGIPMIAVFERSWHFSR